MIKLFAYLIPLLLSFPVSAQMMDFSPMGMGMGSMLGRGSQNMLQLYYENSFPASGSSGVDEFGAHINSSLLHEGQDTYSVRASFDELQVRDNLTVPAWSEGPAANVPSSMESVMLGGGWDRHLQNGDDFGVSLGFGSDSNRPFASWAETTYHITALYRMPYGPHGTWSFFLNYSNNRTFLNGIPIPGAMYTYADLAKRLVVTVGFPIAFVVYGITDLWDVRGSFLIPKSIVLETGYKITPPHLRAFARFEIQQKPFLLDGRDTSTEQLFFERSRVGAGLQMPLAIDLNAELFTGYEYGRSFYDYDMRQESGSVSLPDDWFARAQVNYRF